MSIAHCSGYVKNPLLIWVRGGNLSASTRSLKGGPSWQVYSLLYQSFSLELGHS